MVEEKGEDLLIPMEKIECAEIWSNQFLTIKVQPLNKPMSLFPLEGRAVTYFK